MLNVQLDCLTHVLYAVLCIIYLSQLQAVTVYALITILTISLPIHANLVHLNVKHALMLLIVVYVIQVTYFTIISVLAYAQ